jgi:hypothetical protein
MEHCCVSVINIRDATQNDVGATEIATEAVVMKYMLDTHLDEVWTEFCQQIALSQVFPANPYSLLITKMRQAAQKLVAY